MNSFAGNYIRSNVKGCSGSVYTRGSKIAQRRLSSEEDTPLALLVPMVHMKGKRIHAGAQTTQAAPSILEVLGLSERAMEAVEIERSRLLHGLIH